MSHERARRHAAAATLQPGISRFPSTPHGVVSAAAGPRPHSTGRLLRTVGRALEYITAALVLGLYVLTALAAPVAYEVGL